MNRSPKKKVGNSALARSIQQVRLFACFWPALGFLLSLPGQNAVQEREKADLTKTNSQIAYIYQNLQNELKRVDAEIASDRKSKQEWETALTNLERRKVDLQATSKQTAAFCENFDKQVLIAIRCLLSPVC